MSASERRKGASGEREVAAVFRSVGFDCDRTPNSGGLRIKGDLTRIPHAHIEVKRQEVWRLPLWLEQARSEAANGDVPIVAFRRSRSPWYGAVPLGTLAVWMADAAAFRTEVVE